MLKKTILYLLFFVFSAGMNITQAQCKDSNGVFKCCEMFDDNSVAYLNNFSLKLKKRKTTTDDNGKSWDIFLMQGTKYRFALCSYSGLDKIEMILYEKEKGDSIPIATTFKGGKDKTYFDYSCKKSNLYGVTIRFKKSDTVGEKICAIGLLGFVGKVK